jgi:hypothetical protein
MNKSPELWKIFLSLTVFTFPFVFALRFLFSKSASKMFEDMKGKDNMWQWGEIWQAASLFMAIGSWGAMLTMIFLISALDRTFPVEAWLSVMICTAGSNGLEALIIYVKGKYGAPK